MNFKVLLVHFSDAFSLWNKMEKFSPFHHGLAKIDEFLCLKVCFLGKRKVRIICKSMKNIVWFRFMNVCR